MIQVSVARSAWFDAIVACAETVFDGHGAAAVPQRDVLTANPTFAPENFIVARDGDAVVGVIRLVPQTLLVGGAPLPCMGVSTVCVLPEYRGRGIAARMLERAHAEGERRGAGVAILHARRVLDGFYPPFGYVGIGRYGALEVLEPTGTAVGLDLREGAIEPCHAAHHAAVYGGLTGSFVRDGAFWDFMARTQVAVVGGRTFVLTRGGRTVGYAVVSGMRVLELAWEAGVSCAEAAHACFRLGFTTFDIHPAHPLFRHARAHMTTNHAARFTLVGGYMARVLDAEVLGKTLAGAIGTDAPVEVTPEQARVRIGSDEFEFSSGGTMLRAVLGVVGADPSFCRELTPAANLAACFPDRGFHSPIVDSM
ncbi:MAG: GNAT family N-acetyltransferase [Pseudodesulfovibrio sp.]